MPVTTDNIQFVAAAYAVTAAVLIGYGVYVHRAVRRARAAYAAALAAAVAAGER